jgi:hypothetical protein
MIKNAVDDRRVEEPETLEMSLGEVKIRQASTFEGDLPSDLIDRAAHVPPFDYVGRRHCQPPQVDPPLMESEPERIEGLSFSNAS